MHNIDMVHGDLKGVRFHQFPDARALISMTRQIPSSTKVPMHVCRMLDSAVKGNDLINYLSDVRLGRLHE